MSKNRILIIDDEDNYRIVTKNILEFNGFEVIEARDGYKGIDILKLDSFDVILMDLHLPGMNGLDTIRKIREFNNSIVILMVTGTPSLESSMEASELDVYEYLVKPIEPDKLIRIINEALKETQ